MTPKYLFDKLINNKQFIRSLKNENNINDIIFVIICYYNKYTCAISYYDLPKLIRLIFNFISKEFNLDFDNNEISLAIRFAMIELTVRNDFHEYNDDLSLFNFFVKV